MENPTLKFYHLTDDQVLVKLNEKAVDAQWDVNNAKSPKGRRDAQESLDLFASAVEVIRALQQACTSANKRKEVTNNA